MDQVSFNLPTSNIFVLNGQTVLFQNGALNSQLANEELIQEEIFNKESAPKQIPIKIETMQENPYEGGGYVIVKGTEKENDCRLIHLTVQEAADLGIQFPINNTEQNGIMEVQNAKSQDLIFQKIGDTLNDKVDNTNTVNYLTTGSLDDITKLPSVSKNLNEFTLLPQYANGQIAYALQLTGADEVHAAQNIGIPVTVPTMEVQSVSPATDQLSKFVSPVAVKTVVNKPNKIVDITRSSTSLQNYIPHPKIRIVSKAKHQELRKNNQRKNVPVSKDKFIINRQRQLAPQKLLLPPLARSGKEVTNDSRIQRTNLVNWAGSRNLSTSSEQDCTSNQKLLAVKENERLNESNSANVTKKTSDFLLMNGKNSSTPKTEQLQVLTVAQGSHLPKNIISYNLPNNNSEKKLTPSQLMQVAAALQKNRLTRSSDVSNSSTLYDSQTNTRIICRVLYPEDFASETEKAPVVTNTKKRGRPPYKKETGEKPEKEKGSDRLPARTRSGRVTRPPRHFLEDYKRLKGDDYDDAYSDYHSGTDDNIENSPAVNLLPGLNVQPKRKISSQFRCPTCNKVYLARVRMALHFTKYPDHCDSKRLELLKESTNGDFESGHGGSGKSTWKKGRLSSKGKRKHQRKMLGRLSLEKVLDSYSENEVKHTCGRRVANMLTTWEMLLLRLESKDNQGKCKVQAFLDELESLVKSVRAVSQQILRPPNCEQPNIHLADDAISSLLGMEKGWYSSEDSGFPQQQQLKEQRPPTQHQQQICLEECTASITEIAAAAAATSSSTTTAAAATTTTTQLLLIKDEDVVKVKEELSDLDLLCVQDDPIGVDSVDQIVSERLKTMAPVEDLVCTLPAMPATSTDELVRGLLTDDLINSLETFIPPTQPPDLDFSVLSTEFSSSR